MQISPQHALPLRGPQTFFLLSLVTTPSKFPFLFLSFLISLSRFCQKLFSSAIAAHRPSYEFFGKALVLLFRSLALFEPPKQQLYVRAAFSFRSALLDSGGTLDDVHVDFLLLFHRFFSFMRTGECRLQFLALLSYLSVSKFAPLA